MYMICTMHVKNIFPMDSGQLISLHTMSNNGFYQKPGFTVSCILQWKVENTDDVWHVGKRYICKQNPCWTKFSCTIFITFTSLKPSQVKYICVRGTRFVLGVLYIIGCPVQLIREVFLRLHFRRRHTFASLWGACLRFASLWRANSCGDSCVLGVHLSKVC